MKKHGKKYVEASKNIDKNKLYSLSDAIKLVKETSVTKSANTFLKLDSDTSSSTLWRFELSYDDYNPRYSVFHQLSGEQLVSEGDRESIWTSRGCT